MERLLLKKKLLVIRLYLEGFSYGEIAAKGGVSKGTVSNVIAELKAGQFPQFGDLPEQLELLRDLAIDLKRTRLTPVQSVMGISVLTHLQELKVDPCEIEGLAALYRTLNTEDTDIQTFTRIALSLEEVRKRAGLSIEELEVKVHRLEESASRLEPLVKEVKQIELALKELEKKRESLSREVAELDKRYQTSTENVRYKEQREMELSTRVGDLENRAQSADERLATSRKDSRELSDIGMSPDSLTAFTQRVKVVAQRHSIKPEAVSNKLMDELEQLDKGLGLDTVTKAKEQKLRGVEATILQKQEESVGISSTNEKMRQERSELRAVLSEERKHIAESIIAIKTTAENTGTELKAVLSEERKLISKNLEVISTTVQRTFAELNQNLNSGVGESVSEVNRLRDRALKLGKELGQYNEIIESNKLLKGLQSLLKGDEEVEPDQVRVIEITLVKALLAWLNRHSQGGDVLWLLKPYVINLIGELERWKPQPLLKD